MNVTVLGAGSFGCAIAETLIENKHEVNLWEHSPEMTEKLLQTRENPYVSGAKIDKSINITNNLDVVNDSEIIVFVVPSFALRSVAKQINDMNLEDKIYVLCTKGLEANTMYSGLEILQQEIKNDSKIVILSGPTHAEELAMRKYTTIVSTSDDKEARETVQKVFNCSFLRVYTNDDIKGVEILGAAKNVLAIAAGICDSHKSLGDNAKAALLTRGLRELLILGQSEGCKTETFYGLTGLGDLMVTANSIHSRNRGFGELIGKGMSLKEAQEEIKMVVEGVYSVQAIYQLSQKNNLDLPIILAIYRVLYNNDSIEDVIATLQDRDLKSEV